MGKRNLSKFNNSSFYFSHDSNARNDEKVLQLRMKYGWHGYGLYWALIESLREASRYKLKIEFLSGLAFDLKVDVEELNTFINYCCDIKLLRKNKNSFWSESLLNRMRLMDERKSKLSNAGRKGSNNRWHQGENIQENNPIEDRYNRIIS